MGMLIYGFGLGDDNAGLMMSRISAWAAAITLTYFLNAKVTFGASIRHSRYFNYLLIQALGAGINLGSFSVLVLLGPLEEQPLLALIVGNLLAITNNFLFTRKFVYHFHPEVDDAG
jgi:putative flippase GtrA